MNDKDWPTWQVEVVDPTGSHTIVVSASDAADAAQYIANVEGCSIADIIRAERSR